MKNNFLFLPILFLLVFACTPKKAIQTDALPLVSEEEARQAKAHELAQKYIIIDGHVDLPYRLRISNFRLEREFL